MASPDKEFESNLKKLHVIFDHKQDTIDRCRETAEQICIDTLKSWDIQHMPLRARTKKWESAESSIRRRNAERELRQVLKEAVESRGQKWDIYTHEQHIYPHQDEIGSFESPEQMLAALHDFAGIRISLYFPGHTEKVAKILSRRFEFVKSSQKNQSSKGNLSRLQDKLDCIQSRPSADGEMQMLRQDSFELHGRSPKRQRTNDTLSSSQKSQCSTMSLVNPRDGYNDMLQENSEFAPTFPGYKATHLIVRLKESDIPPDRCAIWKDVCIEIQIGTVAMHLWSEIEHDMIYKPVESQDDCVSVDEKRVLDLINGIVLTGEAALSQLEASSKARARKRALDENAKATSYHELASWIEKYCEAKGLRIVDVEWQNISQLFAVLRATDQHRQALVKNMIDKQFRHGYSTLSPLNQLPMAMLSELCTQTPRWDALFDLSHDGLLSQDALRARLWAIHLVHSLNLAMLFGVGEELLDVSDLPSRPSITSFLEILHPERPEYSDQRILSAIMQCCIAVLGPGRMTESVLVRAAIKLPEIHLITGKAVPGVPRIKTGSMTVPGIITRLFPFKANQSESITDTDSQEDLATQNYHAFSMISLIGLHMYMSGINTDSRQLAWQPVHEQSQDFQRKKIDLERCFVSLDPDSSRDTSFSWDLLSHSVKLEVSKFSPISMRKKPVQKRAEDNAILPDDAEGFAMRLHPRKQWHAVKLAWQFASQLHHDSRRGSNASE